MSEQISSRRAQMILFAKNFVKHPLMLGSLIPSSRFLIRKLLGRIDWANTDLIVEYGPGVGTITVELLKHMRPEAKLVVIETNRDFVDFLQETVSDPRLHVVHGSAADVERLLAERELGQADYVISGIPFSTLPAGVGEAVAQATHDVLKPQGRFLVYQFSPAVLQYLEPVFGHIERGGEMRNVPPARLFFCAPRMEAETPDVNVPKAAS
ncbi:class I SAM-dependent methyltransferase [Alkalilimnicola ehrlichii]|uniref:class I SAM-dependent methyltransferase n=1 Tax=Alkalilimnicola ehrlichii TaxID=351052 RepID=UPI002163BB22|nr:rRNA adenine N-6-methyltransferase family protein [Alkalilimnicola ehrlichii]